MSCKKEAEMRACYSNGSNEKVSCVQETAGVIHLFVAEMEAIRYSGKKCI